MKFSGELHEVRLINFSVDKSEVEEKIPAHFKLLDFNGRALISMVDVHLKKMSVSKLLPSFSYRHVAFRLLLDDSVFSGEEPHGIFFLQSFCNNSLVAAAGNMVADYNLSSARIASNGNATHIEQKGKYLAYELDYEAPCKKNERLFQSVRRIDRAYASSGENISLTRITRTEWPIQWADAVTFKTNFFKSAQLEGVFKVNKVIQYVWEDPQRLPILKYALCE
ncbi:MAG: DUF2071 domain-containing protein [Flavobacteriales bacterium]